MPSNFGYLPQVPAYADPGNGWDNVRQDLHGGLAQLAQALQAQKAQEEEARAFDSPFIRGLYGYASGATDTPSAAPVPSGQIQNRTLPTQPVAQPPPDMPTILRQFQEQTQSAPPQPSPTKKGTQRRTFGVALPQGRSLPTNGAPPPDLGEEMTVTARPQSRPMSDTTARNARPIPMGPRNATEARIAKDLMGQVGIRRQMETAAITSREKTGANNDTKLHLANQALAGNLLRDQRKAEAQIQRDQMKLNSKLKAASAGGVSTKGADLLRKSLDDVGDAISRAQSSLAQLEASGEGTESATGQSIKTHLEALQTMYKAREIQLKHFTDELDRRAPK